jgi:hypothetical protein
MSNSRIGEMIFSALATLAFTVGLTHSDIAAAGNISTVVALIHTTRPIVDAAPASPIPRDEFFDRQISASDHRAVLKPRTFACATEGCPARAVVASDTTSLATSGASIFQTRITWQSGFSLAGSRVWTKVIKFSSNGINIRLPLN